MIGKVSMIEKRYVSSATWVFLVFILLAGCAVQPSESTVKDVIRNYFEAKEYRVIALEIGEMKAVPLSEKKYMGTEGYRVDVQLLTLEVIEDMGAPNYYKSGQQFTFQNGSISIKEDPAKKGRWILNKISGNLVP